MCSNIGTPNNHHFPFGTNGKVVVLGVPILKHVRVLLIFKDQHSSLLRYYVQQMTCLQERKEIKYNTVVVNGQAMMFVFFVIRFMFRKWDYVDFKSEPVFSLTGTLFSLLVLSS